MDTTTLTIHELARRLCVAEHPHFSTTGSGIPCGTHRQQAGYLWPLTETNGTTALKVIIEARNDTNATPKLMVHELPVVDLDELIAGLLEDAEDDKRLRTEAALEVNRALDAAIAEGQPDPA